MDTDVLLTLARWMSPAYPTGAFAWSHGLESAIADGWVTDAGSLRDWIGDVIVRGSGRTDAILIAAAWRCAPDDLPDLADLATTLCPSAERRAESAGLGAAFAAATRESARLDLADLPYPVAIGRAAALARLPLRPTLALHLQQIASGQVQAALRLMPLGQTAGLRVLHDLAPVCARTAAACDHGDLDALGSATFGVDIAAMRHETLAPRLFRS